MTKKRLFIPTETITRTFTDASGTKYMIRLEVDSYAVLDHAANRALRSGLAVGKKGAALGRAVRWTVLAVDEPSDKPKPVDHDRMVWLLIRVTTLPGRTDPRTVYYAAPGGLLTATRGSAIGFDTEAQAVAYQAKHPALKRGFVATEVDE